MIDLAVQQIVDSNAADISAVFPSHLSRAFKEDPEFAQHPHYRIFIHFTNVYMLVPTSNLVTPGLPVQLLVQPNNKHKKLLVKENEPLVRIGDTESGLVLLAPFEGEVLANSAVTAAHSYLVLLTRKHTKAATRKRAVAAISSQSY